MTDTPMFTGQLQFLSNFNTNPFVVPTLGVPVASGEHAFNALKTLDPVQRAHVLAAASPGTAKKRGQAVTLRTDWDTGARVMAMQQVLQAKFAPGNEHAQLLVATGNTLLVETNHWHDQFWGDCYCPRHAHIVGTNMLGQLLMSIRCHLAG